MPDYFHGTKQPFANTIVSGAVDVSKGSGEFGVGFYTQDRSTDAWHWAIARWKKRDDKPAVVQITITAKEFSTLRAKGPLNHKQSNKLRATSGRRGKSVFIVGVDVIVGTIQDRPQKTQEKFESSTAQTLLNSRKVKRGLHAGS